MTRTSIMWRSIAVALLLAGLAGHDASRAQPADATRDATRPPVGGVASPADAMIFYVACGPAGARGADCTEWIAAEGAVQWDTHKRLMALLDRLGSRKLPLVLDVRHNS